MAEMPTTLTLEIEQGASFRRALWQVRGLVLCQFAAGVAGGLVGSLLFRLLGF